MATPPSDVVGSSSHPPYRCEYPSSDEEAIEEPGLFDVATYVLLSRRLGYGGFLQCHPPVGGPEAEVPPLQSCGHVDISWLSKTFKMIDILTQHLEVVMDFDWGASGLATLYGNLGACSWDKSPILGGHYRVLEVWFDPWGGVLEDAPLARSRVLDRTRSLLEGPFCRAWYIGDRVASQWHPRAKTFQFVPPPPPPASMRSTSLISKEDLKNARIRDWAGLLLQAGDYMEYYHLFLASAVAAPPVAPVWPRAPSFVSFHSDDGEEERLALIPCTTQLYMLPAEFNSWKQNKCRRCQLLRVLESVRAGVPELVMRMLELMIEMPEVKDRGLVF
ncbi:hypothetical protein RHMOL_Rhmol10G0178300 [Rhododendron molle]|uniref:Uncharacterized protein n=1 Tax=Rhododendron molle TaxID=49168 RepID=A0ACC0M3Y7_RHOML|nr:hypothetical protein RHMOL_Rhmol10G0178300 [Rhododendron molle]